MSLSFCLSGHVFSSLEQLSQKSQDMHRSLKVFSKCICHCHCHCHCLCICLRCCLFVGQVIFSYDSNQFCRVSVWSGRPECFESITMSESAINQGRPRAARAAKKGRKTNLGFKFPLFFPCPSLSLWQSPPCRKKQQQSDIRNIRTLTRMTWLQHVMTLCCRNGINNSLQIIFSIWGGFEKTRTQIVWMKPLN